MRSEAEIDIIARRFYARVFSGSSADMSTIMQVAIEEFDLDPQIPQRQLKDVVRVLAADFYRRTGLEQSPRANTNERIIREYVDSLGRKDSGEIS